MVKVRIDREWIDVSYDKNLIFVIRPGAGTFQNKLGYQNLENYFNVIYFGETGGEYDKYPQNWNDNKLVLNTGKHLGGICELVTNYIIYKNEIPGIIITGSRGGQVTLGKIWENIWRGPSIIINAGVLTTRTNIPKEVNPLFITMGKDYFTSVNNINKVEKLFNKLKEKENQNGYIVYLENEGHMPDMNKKFLKLLQYCSNYLLNMIKFIPNFDNKLLFKKLI